jgi:hypothetical protein
MPARLAINFVLVLDKAERKREIMAVELQRYFGETCPALTARWERQSPVWRLLL